MYHYQLYIRIWHAVNALLFLVLILTGLSMEYVDKDSTFIPFSLSVRMHNISGILLSANYLIFLIGNRISRNGKHYRIRWSGLSRRLIKQARYYAIGYFRKEEPPYPLSVDVKFNPLQAFTYAIAMYIGLPLLVITGWGLLFPDAVLERVFGLSGFMVADILHVVAGFLLTVFMMIHIYICTIGHAGANFRAILSGWHTVEH